MKKLLFGLIAIFLTTTNVAFSQTETTNNFVDFKFVNPESIYKIKGDNYREFDKSDFLVVKVEALPDKITFFKSDELVSIDYTLNEQQGTFYCLKKCPDLKIRYGLFYGGGDCAVWGTFITDEEGTAFIPGSAATQELLGVCGLSNVCKTIRK